jgi:peptide/nickel transport system substrate-binding protein
MHLGTKRLGGLVALTVAGLLGVAACGTSSNGSGSSAAQASAGYAACATSPDTCNSGSRKDGGDIVVALGKYPSTWNTWSSDGNVVETVQQENLIVPGAYTFLPSGKIQWNQDLLASEPQVTSTSPQTVVYKLNPQAKWSNGTPISADDFIYEWKTNNGHDKNIPIVGSTGYDQIQSVTGSDNGETVTVVFSKPYPDWKGLFSEPGLYPAWYAKQKVGGLDTDAQLEAAFKVWDAAPTAWSAGPFTLSNYQSQQSATFTPNTTWYGKDKPTLKTLTFKYITDQTQDIPALQNQEIQALNIQPDQDTVQQLSQTPGVNYEVSAGFSWELWEVNSASKFMKDPALREAVFDATNVQDMIDKTIKPFFPNAKRDYNDNIFPGVTGYEDVTNKATPDAGTGNVAKAKAVLTAAGYKLNGTQLMSPSGEPVTINFVHTDTQVRDQSAQLVTQYLSQLGIKVNDKVTADLGGSLSTFDFDIIQFGFSGSPLLSGDHDLWYKGAGNNFTNWSDPQSDQLLDQMSQTLDPAKEAALLNQQDAIMAKAYVTLALYQKPNLQVATNQYINIRDNNAGSYFTYNTQQWGLNASAQ